MIIVGLALLCGAASCHRCVPERFAVNAPLLSLLLGRTAATPTDGQIKTRLQVPPGFTLSLYADGIANARWMRVTAAGDLLVSQPRSGQVALLERDGDGDGRPDGRREGRLDG